MKKDNKNLIIRGIVYVVSIIALVWLVGYFIYVGNHL